MGFVVRIIQNRCRIGQDKLSSRQVREMDIFLEAFEKNDQTNVQTKWEFVIFPDRHFNKDFISVFSRPFYKRKIIFLNKLNEYSDSTKVFHFHHRLR